MKYLTKTLTATILVSLSAAAFSADVKIYGQANVSLFYMDTKSGSASLAMQNEASRVGLTAVEELMPGTTVNVSLETGYGLDDGTLSNNGKSNAGTTLFDRRAILSVKNRTWGEFAAGRMGTVRSSMAPYGYGLGMIDPFGTNYGPDGSISGMFGNDARGNNTLTYLSPVISGLRTGLSYSLSTHDNEDAESSHNNRQLSGIVSWQGERFYLVAGATQAWYGRNHSAGADATKYERNDSQVYTLGGWAAVTPTVKAYAAVQYHKDFRNAGAWNIDAYYKGSVNAAGQDPQGNLKHGIDGTTGLIGLTWQASQSVRILADGMFFDGSHRMGSGEKVDAGRYILNAAAEYWFSKTTRAFVTTSWSKGTGALESSRTVKSSAGAQADVNRICGRVGMIHYF